MTLRNGKCDKVPNRTQKVVRGALWMSVARYGNEIVSFIVVGVLARHLAPTDFGVVAYAQVFLLFASLLTDSGTGKAIVRLPVADRRDYSAAFWLQMILSAIFGVLLYVVITSLVSMTEGGTLSTSKVAPVVIALIPTIALGAAAGVPAGISQRNLDFKFLATRDCLATIAGGVAGIGAALLGFGVWSLVVQRYMGRLTVLVLLWVRVDFVPLCAWDWARMRRLWALGLPIAAIDLVSYVNAQIAVICVGTISGAASLGLFSMATRILQLLVQTVTGPAQSVGLAAFASIQEDKIQAARRVVDMQVVVSALIMPVLVAFVVVAPEALMVAFGPRWEASATIFRIIAPAGLIQALTIPLDNYLIGLGHSRLAVWQKIVYAVSLAGLLAAAVPWGLVGFAIAFSLRGYLIVPLLFFWLGRAIGYQWPRLLWLCRRVFLFAIIAGVLGIGVLQVLHSLPLLLSVSLTGFVTIGCYIVLMLKWGAECLQVVSEYARHVPSKGGRQVASEVEEVLD